MRTQRGRFDITKPFRLITNRVEFDALVATEKLFPPPKLAEHQEKSENIVVPRIQKVKRLTTPKEFAVINSNYIRLPAHLNLPKIDGYELSEVDFLFLNKLRKRDYLVSAGITEEFLRKTIMAMEKKAGRDNVIPRGKGWMDAFIEKQYRNLTQLPNYAQLSTELYNYWRSRREELRFPLYRPLWKPHENQLNHLLAFKARQKITRNRRRNNRIDELDLLQQLSDQFYNAAKLCQRIRVRQDFKLKSIQLQAASFFQQCLLFSNLPPPFALPSSLSFRNEDRQKHRKLRQSLQEFKKRRDNQQDPQQQFHENVETRQITNQSDTLVNFLSSVVYQAGKLGISHDIIFPDSYQRNVPKKIVPVQERLEQAILPAMKDDLEEIAEAMPFKLKRYGDMLVRSVSEEDDNEILHTPEDYLDFKRKRVQSAYFGSDDNIGDFRELRKNISSSFKKFLQLTTMGNNNNQSSNN